MAIAETAALALEVARACRGYRSLGYRSPDIWRWPFDGSQYPRRGAERNPFDLPFRATRFVVGHPSTRCLLQLIVADQRRSKSGVKWPHQGPGQMNIVL